MTQRRINDQIAEIIFNDPVLFCEVILKWKPDSITLNRKRIQKLF
ncbi:MAG: hypothetical protein ACPLY9_02375 [Nitrososphaerales archaeon]